MIRTPARLVLPPVLLLAALLAPAAAKDPEGAVDRLVVPGTEPEVDEGEAAVEAVLVVRAIGPGRVAPIEGARVRCFTEDCRGASQGAELVAEARTDAHGVAVLEGVAGVGFHWLVDAPGHGTRHEYCGFGSLDWDPVVLRPAVDRTLRILDPFGRPLAGARVEVVMGCGHSPAAQSGTTDEAGLVTLGPVDDDYYDLWIEAEGVRPDRYALPPVPTDGSVPEILTEPARTARGTVVDREGRPVAGATVRELDRFRGPKTGTDGEGRFVLTGLTGEEALGVFLPEAPFDVTPAVVVDAFTPDVPLRLVVDPGRPTAPGDGEPRHRVDVVVEGANSLVPITCVRTSDGFTVHAASNLWCNSFDLPPGRYRITVGGRFSYHTPHEATVEVPLAEGGAVTVRLEGEAASCGLTVSEEVWDASVELRIPGYATELSLASPHAWMPNEGPAAAVLLGPRPIAFFIEEGHPEEGFRTATIELPEPTVFRFRTVDATGAVLASDVVSEMDLEVFLLDEDERIQEVVTHATGEIAFTLEADGYEPREVVYVLPAREQRIDLGDLVLERALEPLDQRVTLLDGRGGLVEEAELALDDQRCEENVHDNVEPGVYVVTLVTPTRSVLVYAQGFLPMPATLTRGHDETLRFPAGRIELTVKDPDGAPLPAVVWLGGYEFHGEEGRVILDGVPAGAYDLLVGSKGRRGRVVPVTVGEDDVLRTSVVLR